jgi:NADH dehydrogenase
MKVAITGGTGFVGRNIAREMAAAGHDVVLIARGQDRTDPSIRRLLNIRFTAAGLDDVLPLQSAFAGCEIVFHCAGVNREMGNHTFERVHVEGTRHVVEAARLAGVRKVVLISFLRARPNTGSGYHDSKWAAEEIVRSAGLDHTVLKCGVIYGPGDHMLNHLSHAFHTFPVFGLVGFREQFIRPLAVEDLARLASALAVEGACSRQTVAVLGPEKLTLREAVMRVARVVGRRPAMFPMPVAFHYAFAWLVERVMVVPVVSRAQVRILYEGLTEPWGEVTEVPATLAPRIPFSDEQIRKGLPRPGPFGFRDLRCCRTTATDHAGAVAETTL